MSTNVCASTGYNHLNPAKIFDQSEVQKLLNTFNLALLCKIANTFKGDLLSNTSLILTDTKTMQDVGVVSCNLDAQGTNLQVTLYVDGKSVPFVGTHTRPVTYQQMFDNMRNHRMPIDSPAEIAKIIEQHLRDDIDDLMHELIDGPLAEFKANFKHKPKGNPTVPATTTVPMSVRKSSGCVVFRITKKRNVEFLLVTSTSGKGWVMPKGGVEFHLDERTSAVKETLEEAGAIVSAGSELGKYRYVKNGIMNDVVMFAALFQEYAADWLEENKRERAWFKLDKALSKLDPYLGAFLVDVASMVEANEIHENAKRAN